MTNQSLLNDRKACVQALNHLKLGVSPWRGLDFLSVGLDSQERVINQALLDAKRGETRTLLIESEYGFGKTHLLRLARELADRMGMVVSHITHDPLRNVAFNKPMNVYAEILTDLCREYPHASYGRLLEQLAPAYLARHQMAFRTVLPERLAELGASLAPAGFRGCLILIDEIEGLSTASMPNRRSREIAYEVLVRLMSGPTGPRGCVLALAVTPGTLERFEDDWNPFSRPIIGGNGVQAEMSFLSSDIEVVSGARLTDKDALLLHSRIDAVHAIARDRPKTDPAELSGIGNDLIRLCIQPDRSLHFRTFVQACVTDFDIRYLRALDGKGSSTVRTSVQPLVLPENSAPSTEVRNPDTPPPADRSTEMPHATQTARPASPALEAVRQNGSPVAPTHPVAPTLQPPGILRVREEPSRQERWIGAGRGDLVPGAAVVYQSPVGFRIASTIVTIDWDTGTARVILTRFRMEVTVSVDRLAVRR